MSKHVSRYALIVCLLLVAWLGACGRKGPPVPPGYLAPPAVTDLHYQVNEDALTLEWSAPKAEEGRVYDIAAAKVYRFKTPLENAVCRDCPLTLTLVGNIPFSPEGMQYGEPLEKGHQYAYQVIWVGSTGKEGGKSNIVEFLHE